MKIGVVAHYIGTRPDIRDFIVELSLQQSVVLYLNGSDMHLGKHLPASVEVRAIKTVLPGHIGNIAATWLFALFGKLPRSRNNYFITEEFKYAAMQKRNAKAIINYALFRLSYFTPKFISYDSYLRMLRFSKATNISDIDAFIFFTPVYDDMFLLHAFDEQKPVSVYVYSWDHPCKMKCFSKRVDKYLVWNSGLKNDLVDLQAIDPARISVYGSTQLVYIHDYKAVESFLKPNRYPFKYLYFGCATGYPKLAEQEIAYIADIARALENYPELKLLVRPYPFLKLWEQYDKLRQHNNIVFDESYRSTEGRIANMDGLIFDKLNNIAHATAFFHLGTTMGFEAAYFDIPVFMLAYKKPRMNLIDGFIHQYQNDKYLIAPNVTNVIRSSKMLVQVISDTANGVRHTAYNRTVTNTTAVNSMKDLLNSLRPVGPS